MTNELFISDEDLMKLQATHKLRVILQREKKEYLNKLHRRCAVGLSTKQFEDVVDNLVANGWCFRNTGPKRGTMLIVNEQWAATQLPMEQAQ